MSSKRQTLTKPGTMTLFHIAERDAEAIEELWRELIFQQTSGEPWCQSCGSFAAVKVSSRRRLRCKVCLTEFTLTSVSAFSSVKLPLKKLLMAISIFISSPHGVSALEISESLHFAKSAANVLLHRLRELMAKEQLGWILDDVVEIDGGYFGGYMRPPRLKWKRKDGRKFKAGAKSVVFLRERSRSTRKGRCISAVFDHEAQSHAFVRERVAPTAHVMTDDAPHWKKLNAWFLLDTVHHATKLAEYKPDKPPIHTNNVECAVGRLRKAEDIYHRITGTNLHLYAAETAWRLNHAGETPDEKLRSIMKLAATTCPSASAFRGMYQRRTGRNASRRPDHTKTRDAGRPRAVKRVNNSTTPGVAPSDQSHTATPP